MKILAESAIEQLEEKYNCMVLSDRYDLTLTLNWLNNEDYDNAIKELKTNKVSYITNYAKPRTVLIKQESLVNICSFEEERVWLTEKKQRAVLVKELDHQRLSNIVGLLEIMLKKGKITQVAANDYLQSLQENIIPEIQERFNGELLEYKPFYDWEWELVKAPNI